MSAHPISDRLGRAFATLTHDLAFPYGEGDDGHYRPFSGTLVQPLSAEGFRSSLRLARWWDIRLEDGEASLAEILATYRDSDRSFEPGTRDTFETLQSMMFATLERPLQAVLLRTGNSMYRWHYTRLYVFGGVQDGGVAGFTAYFAET